MIVRIAAVVALAALPAPGRAGPALDAGQVSYRAGRFEAARKIWEPRAQAGDAAAQFGLGTIYDLGQGVTADGRIAFDWYLQAARQGLPEAEYAVAGMIDSGDGHAFDATAAATWYARTASHGQGNAAYILGKLYEAGQGVPRNLDVARAWYGVAHDAIAARRLEIFRKEDSAATGGDLVPPDPVPGPNGTGELDLAPGELVWTAPAEPVAVRYVVTILAVDGAMTTQIFATTTDKSAIVTPPLANGDYVWRVYAASLTGGHYAASRWRYLRR